MVKKQIISKKSIYDSERRSFTLAIFFSVLTLFVSIISKYTSSLGEITNILMDLFGSIGYDLTFFGILLGIIYSFILGFIIGYLYSTIYNWLPSKN